MKNMKNMFRMARRALSRRAPEVDWGRAAGLSPGRLLRYWPAYLHAVPRIEEFDFTFPDEKAALIRDEGIGVREYAISPDGLERFRSRCDYSTHYLGGPGEEGFREKGYLEKSLEHYLSFTLLEIGKDDTLIDVAAAHSNYAENVKKLAGCRVLRQDLEYPEGFHGDMIGGDAGCMPVPDGFATALTLHCSLEHFEGDADIRFIREAARVLAPGGRFIILPLYFERHHLNITQPELWNPELPRDSGAAWYFPPRRALEQQVRAFLLAPGFPRSDCRQPRPVRLGAGLVPQQAGPPSGTLVRFRAARTP